TPVRHPLLHRYALTPPPLLSFYCSPPPRDLHSFPTRRSSDLRALGVPEQRVRFWMHGLDLDACAAAREADGRAPLRIPADAPLRSEEHTSELQSRFDLVCRLLLEKKKKILSSDCLISETTLAS